MMLESLCTPVSSELAGGLSKELKSSIRNFYYHVCGDAFWDPFSTRTSDVQTLKCTLGNSKVEKLWGSDASAHGSAAFFASQCMVADSYSFPGQGDALFGSSRRLCAICRPSTSP